ncbi:putative ATP-dependent RNA helicase ddx49 [Balamuthia mandrillaris]
MNKASKQRKSKTRSKEDEETARALNGEPQEEEEKEESAEEEEDSEEIEEEEEEEEEEGEEEEEEEAQEDEEAEISKEASGGEGKSPEGARPAPKRRPKDWEDLGLSRWLIDNCREMGLYTPTLIQEHCVPPALQGRDIIGSAETGSGKTAAFALPILQKLSEDPFGIFALVLTPTRELAFQIADQFRALGNTIGLRVAVIVGGMDRTQQGIELTKRPHVVIATPGRLMDHLQSHQDNQACFKKLRFLVLDEADRLLEKSFAESMGCLLSIMPRKRQTLLFSATMNESIRRLEKSNPNMFRFDASPEGKTYQPVAKLLQEYMFMPAKVKDCYLVYLLREFEAEQERRRNEQSLASRMGGSIAEGVASSASSKKKTTKTKLKGGGEGAPDGLSGLVGSPPSESSIIIFTSTCSVAQLVASLLTQLELPATPLHSQLSQADRNRSLFRFRSSVVRILVATDVASRGLDIPTVALVINYDVPGSTKDYMHRIGRTGRADKEGHAITLVTQFDVERVLSIEQETGQKLTEHKAKETDVLVHLNEASTAKKLAELRLDETGFWDKIKQKRKEKRKGKGKKRKTNQDENGASEGGNKKGAHETKTSNKNAQKQPPPNKRPRQTQST